MIIHTEKSIENEEMFVSEHPFSCITFRHPFSCIIFRHPFSWEMSRRKVKIEKSKGRIRWHKRKWNDNQEADDTDSENRFMIKYCITLWYDVRNMKIPVWRFWVRECLGGRKKKSGHDSQVRVVISPDIFKHTYLLYRMELCTPSFSQT